MVFDMKAPRPDYQLVLQAWDFDIFKKNDYLCEWTLDLRDLFETVQRSQRSRCFDNRYFEAWEKA
jgi:hypothetical protein